MNKYIRQLILISKIDSFLDINVQINIIILYPREMSTQEKKNETILVEEFPLLSDYLRRILVEYHSKDSLPSFVDKPKFMIEMYKVILNELFDILDEGDLEVGKIPSFPIDLLVPFCADIVDVGADQIYEYLTEFRDDTVVHYYPRFAKLTLTQEIFDQLKKFRERSRGKVISITFVKQIADQGYPDKVSDANREANRGYPVPVKRSEGSDERPNEEHSDEGCNSCED